MNPLSASAAGTTDCSGQYGPTGSPVVASTRTPWRSEALATDTARCLPSADGTSATSTLPSRGIGKSLTGDHVSASITTTRNPPSATTPRKARDPWAATALIGPVAV